MIMSVPVGFIGVVVLKNLLVPDGEAVEKSSCCQGRSCYQC
jgi:hypothetical protein